MASRTSRRSSPGLRREAPRAAATADDDRSTATCASAGRLRAQHPHRQRGAAERRRRARTGAPPSCRRCRRRRARRPPSTARRRRPAAARLSMRGASSVACAMHGWRTPVARPAGLPRPPTSAQRRRVRRRRRLEGRRHQNLAADATSRRNATASGRVRADLDDLGAEARWPGSGSRSAPRPTRARRRWPDAALGEQLEAGRRLAVEVRRDDHDVHVAATSTLSSRVMPDGERLARRGRGGPARRAAAAWPAPSAAGRRCVPALPSTVTS